jgi:hypothetical protein
VNTEPISHFGVHTIAKNSISVSITLQSKRQILEIESHRFQTVSSVFHKEL